MQIYLQYFNKNSSTAVPLRNERYEEFFILENCQKNGYYYNLTTIVGFIFAYYIIAHCSKNRHLAL